jgi:hypothetical protein
VATVVSVLVAALVCGRLANKLHAQVGGAARGAGAGRGAAPARGDRALCARPLLASVSHDLRTRYSTIIGAAESLSPYRDRLGADDQQRWRRRSCTKASAWTATSRTCST